MSERKPLTKAFAITGKTAAAIARAYNRKASKLLPAGWEAIYALPAPDGAVMICEDAHATNAEQEAPAPPLKLMPIDLNAALFLGKVVASEVGSSAPFDTQLVNIEQNTLAACKGAPFENLQTLHNGMLGLQNAHQRDCDKKDCQKGRVLDCVCKAIQKVLQGTCS